MEQLIDTPAIRAIRIAFEMIEETARDLHPEPLPSGICYAVLSEHGMSLAVYNALLHAMESAGKITVENHTIRLP